MKRLFAAFIVLLTCSCGPATPTTQTPPAPPTIPANSLVQNGDFSQGLAHWDGDGQISRGGSLIIALSPTTWSRIYQTFSAGKGTLFSINVNYKLMRGLTTSDSPADYAQITHKIQVAGFDNYHSQQVNPHQFYGILGNPGDSLITSEVYDPDYNSTDVQNYQHTYAPVPASDQKTFCLAFPPGNGTVVILGVAVTSN